MKKDVLFDTSARQDEAGNLIVTSYVDLRDPGMRSPVHTLVKGCKREHALEDSPNIRIAPPREFRTEGANLIRDEQEGLAKEETETVEPETPAEAAMRRRYEDLNEAHELLDSGIRTTYRATHRSVQRSVKTVAFGKEWWIFSTAIAPEREEDLTAWRRGLDPDYDHVSEIGQPARFAEALGRMVAEQLGPQGRDATVEDGDAGGTRRCKSQWIMHGPVVYADSLYDALADDADEATRVAAMIFTKSSTHAGLREYRFAILKDGVVEEPKLLRISDMLRDALRRAEDGADAPATPMAGTRVTGSRKLLHRNAKSTERVAEWAESRLERRGPDGEILSSTSHRREDVRQTSETRDLLPDDGPEPECPHSAGDAADEPGPNGVSPGFEDGPERSDEPPLEDPGGRSLEQGFADLLNNPAVPTGPTTETWAESALSDDEFVEIYRFLATLAFQVTRLAPVPRQEASSACWHAVQCIRNILARLGRIVDTVAIERDRFVVVRLKRSPGAGAAGRIVVTPAGDYAYCLKQEGSSKVGCGENHTGMVFFPMDSQLAVFEEYGWTRKEVG